MLGGLLIQLGHLVLQGGPALGLCLALRPQGGGGALQRLDPRLGLRRIVRVLLHAAAHLLPLSGQALAAQLNLPQLHLGALRPLRVLQHGVLRLAQLGGGGVQLILRGGDLPLGFCQLVPRGLQVGAQPVLLPVQPFQLVGPGQNARRAGHGPARHGPARVEHLAVQGDDAEAVAEFPGHGHGLVHVAGDDHPAQQVGEDAGVLPVKGDERIPHP